MNGECTLTANAENIDVACSVFCGVFTWRGAGIRFPAFTI